MWWKEINTHTHTAAAAANADANNVNKKVIFRICAPFINCINEISNTQEDNAKEIDIVMSMYNLTEYSDSYSKSSKSVWKYHENIPALNNNGEIVQFNGGIATDSFN